VLVSCPAKMFNPPKSVCPFVPHMLPIWYLSAAAFRGAFVSQVVGEIAVQVTGRNQPKKIRFLSRLANCCQAPRYLNWKNIKSLGML